MPNPVNEDLTSWQPDHKAADSNAPTSGSSAGTGQSQELAGNFRLLKSVLRELATHMSWERWKGVKNLAGDGNITFTFVSATQFRVNDNFTATGRNIATPYRRVRATVTAGTIYGTITSASFSSPNTTVTVAWDSGQLDTGLSEVEFGVEHRSVGGLRGYGISEVAPTNGQTLVFNGTIWVPQSASTDHNSLTNVTSDQHHAKSHAHDGVDGSGVVNHASLAGVSADQHHPKSHAHNGVDGSGVISHISLNGIGPDDHHLENHRFRHISGGADAFLSSDLLEAIVKRLRESGGATLTLGSVADGQLLLRSGTNIVGSGVPNSSVGTAQLKTATGSATGSLGDPDFSVDLTLNDFSFFPSITSNVDGAIQVRAVPVADPGNTIARFQLFITNGNAAYTVRWRYVTASDDPTIWVLHDSSGKIVAVWTSDDPTPGGEPGIRVAGLTPMLVKASDLKNLAPPAHALRAADERIERAGMRSSHRLYRAVQALANDDAPARWILDNCKVGASGLETK